MSFDMDIPDHWHWATIAEVQSSEKRSTITGPFGSSIGKKFFVEHGVPVIRGNNLSLGSTKFKDEGFVFISEDKAEELHGYKAFKHDLIFTAAGTIGQVGIIPGNTKYEYYIISNKQMRARFDTDKVDPMFAYYWFSSPWMVDYIKRHDTGSTIPLINLGVLRSLPIPLPPVVEQVAIRQYLFMIDEKINNNYKINQTLEQMAQALFKSWFVDFEPVKAKIVALDAGGSQEDATLAAMTAISGKDADALVVFEREQPEQYAELKATAELFPSAMQESELGEIPEGWGVTNINNTGKVVCGKTPSKKEPKYYDGKVPFIKIPDMHGNLFILRTKEYLSEAGSNSQIKKLIPAGAICVSCIATIGVVSITTQPSHTNQQINTVIPSSSSLLYYLYFGMIGMKDYLHRLGSAGSATLNVNTSIFSAINILLPKLELLEAFHVKCAPLFKSIKSFSLQNESLTQLRDTLLPKLLSGEITLPEAEQAFSEVEHV